MNDGDKNNDNENNSNTWFKPISIFENNDPAAYVS